MSEERFDRIEARLDRIEGLHERLSASHEQLQADVHKLTVLHEDTRHQVKLIWEALGATNERMDRGFDLMNRRFDGLERLMTSFIATQGGLNRDLSDRDADLDRRVSAIEKRNRGAL